MQTLSQLLWSSEVLGCTLCTTLDTADQQEDAKKILALEGQICSACCNHDDFSTSATLTHTDLPRLLLRSDRRRSGFNGVCLCQFNYINQITSSHGEGDPPLETGCNRATVHLNLHMTSVHLYLYVRQTSYT